MPYLRTDCYSSYDNSKLYGKAGERVTVKSDHGGALIVETEAGIKIPLNRRDICEEWPADGEYVAPPFPVREVWTSRKQSKKAKSMNNDQPDLFS